VLLYKPLADMARGNNMFHKLKNLLLVFVIGIVSLIGINKINALPTSISGVNAGELISYDGSVNLFYKTYGNGVFMCTTFHVPGVGSNCSLSTRQWSDPTAQGVAAIIEKYNAAPSVKNYYYAELAINEFLYYRETGNSVNKIRQNEETRNLSGVKSFYDVAVNAWNDAKKDFNISLNTDKLVFTLIGDNYISNKVTVSGSDKYTINLSGVDGASYEQNGNEFFVKVPNTSVRDGATVSVTAVVSASKSVSIAKQYDCGSGNQSGTINAVEKSNKISDKSIGGTITKEKKITKLKISKQDLTNRKELPGATLILKNAKGEEVDKWISSDKPHYVEELEPGKYTLTEIIAPDGYKLSKETIEFDLKADNNVTEVIMYNAVKDKYKVKISKQDITTKMELPGATLVLKNSKGEEIDRWVSGTEPHYLELDKGEYTLVEIQAPNGYDLSYEVIKFSVGDFGEVETTVVMYNSKTPDTAGKNITIFIIITIIGASGVGLSLYKLKHQK